MEGVGGTMQGELLPDVPEPVRASSSGTFVPNMKLPVHRWFRYSAGFSAGWVAEELYKRSGAVVLDPFVGSGTVLIEADRRGGSSYGVEAHPFVYRLASGKLAWDTDIKSFESAISNIRGAARYKKRISRPPKPLLAKCYAPKVLEELYELRDGFLAEVKGMTQPVADLSFLALTSILRASSHAGTAQWQYILPNKRKVTVTTPSDALNAQVAQMLEDMRYMQSRAERSRSTLLQGDSRTLEGVSNDSIDLVITSPPYANNYDYADATRLEMTFWGEVDSWGGLHETVRQFLICSSSQHASKEKFELEQILADPLLEPIQNELRDVCNRLAKIRGTKGGNKSYHTMIAAYFRDMASTIGALRRVLKKGGDMCMVVGDSAPYGIHAPVDRWLGELSLAAGFRSWRFDKIRDRNTKWKNRKHTVPLQEGRLWING